MTYYDHLTNYDELYGEEQEHKLAIIQEYVGDCGSVLDVGCGTFLSKKFFSNITGIDPSAELLHGQGIVGIAEALPFVDHSFDLVICVTVLQNIHNKEKALQEMKRVSKGNIAITLLKKSPQFDHIKTLVLTYFPKCVEIDEGKDIIFHTLNNFSV